MALYGEIPPPPFLMIYEQAEAENKATMFLVENLPDLFAIQQKHKQKHFFSFITIYIYTIVPSDTCIHVML